MRFVIVKPDTVSELQNYLEAFIKQCSEREVEKGGEKAIGWESLVAILVYQGIKLLLPELKEWVKLGGAWVALKRQEIKKRLVDYAHKKELSFPEAEKAAEVIAAKLNEENIAQMMKELEDA